VGFGCLGGGGGGGLFVFWGGGGLCGFFFFFLMDLLLRIARLSLAILLVRRLRVSHIPPSAPYRALRFRRLLEFTFHIAVLASHLPDKPNCSHPSLAG